MRDNKYFKVEFHRTLFSNLVLVTRVFKNYVINNNYILFIIIIIFNIEYIKVEF